MTRRMFSSRVAVTATFTMLAMGGAAACDSAEDNPNEDGVFYCTNSEGVVVDEDLCDDRDGSYDGGGVFFMSYMGSSLHTDGGHRGPYKAGQRLPVGHQRFKLNDMAARSKFGLPPTGKITNGTVKPNVVGKGGPGSTARSTSSKSGG